MRSVASLASELSLWMLTVLSLYLRLVKAVKVASSLCIMTPMTMASASPSPSLRLVTVASLTSIPSHLVSAARQMCPLP